MGSPREPRDVDRGWAWVVMFGAFMIQMTVGIVLYSLGVVQIILLGVFDGGVIQTTWVLGIVSSLLSLPGPLVGLVTNVTSCRTTILLGSGLLFIGSLGSAFVTELWHLYITLSVITGFGLAFVYTPSLVVLGFYFDKNVQLATAMAVTGGGVGMMVGAPLLAHLDDTYGWRGMFLIMAGIGGNSLVWALICRPNSLELAHVNRSRNQSNSSTETREKCPDKIRWRTRAWETLKAVCRLPVILFCGSLFLSNITTSLVTLHLPNYLAIHGVSTAQSALLITPMGLGSILARLLTGVVSKVGCLDKYVIYTGSYGLMGLVTLGFPFVPISFTMSIIYAGIFGFCTGGPYVVQAPIAKELVGLRHLAVTFGVGMMLCGVGALVGPPIAGGLLVMSGSYTWSFLFAGVSCVCSSILGVMLMKYKKPAIQDELDIQPQNIVA